MFSKSISVAKFSSEEPSIDEALKKLARAGDDFSNMRDYARVLVKRFDKNLNGIISFQELCDGLTSMDIILSLKDRVALMKKLDMNRDGEISDTEIYRALSTVEAQLSKETVELALKKIVSGASDFSNLKDYSKMLIKRFDGNSDGLISFEELTDGLRKMKIYLNNREMQVLMDKLDLNKDGEINQEELLRVLQSVEASAFPRFGPSLNVEQALRKLASGAETFYTMKEYARFLIKQFDGNQDGIISQLELSEGLKSLGINMTSQES